MPSSKKTDRYLKVIDLVKTIFFYFLDFLTSGIWLYDGERSEQVRLG